MASPKGTRIGLLLILTAGPFLVFLFLHLFGKNHFELDRYETNLKELMPGIIPAGDNGFLLADTGNSYCENQAFKAQINRFVLFTEDFGKKPSIQFFSSSGNSGLSLKGKDWFLSDKVVPVKSARGSGVKQLPSPPRAFLFDSSENLRGVYGLCNEKSVDSLMLEYQILISP